MIFQYTGQENGAVNVRRIKGKADGISYTSPSPLWGGLGWGSDSHLILISIKC
jgi:hypothetical protein